MVCSGINQSGLGTTPNKSDAGARKSNPGSLNYGIGLKVVIDLWHLIICLSVHPYILMCPI